MMLIQLSKKWVPPYQSQAANQPKLHVSDFPLHGSDHPHEILTFVSKQRHVHGLLLLQNQTVQQHLQRWEFLADAGFLRRAQPSLCPRPPTPQGARHTKQLTEVITAGMGWLREHYILILHSELRVFNNALKNLLPLLFSLILFV